MSGDRPLTDGTDGATAAVTRSPLVSERVRNQIFAAPADDPRARRTADAVTVALSIISVLLLAWSHRGRSDLDTRVLEFLADGIPGWVSGIATIVFVLGALYAIGLMVGIAVFARDRWSLVRDMLAGTALVWLGVIALSYLAGPEFPDLIPELFERDGYPSFPVARLTTTVAIIGIAGPFLAVPMRRIGRRLVVTMALSAIVLSYGTVSAVLGGLLFGVAVSSSVHLLFGSGKGIPSKARIAAALGEAGLDVDDLEYAAEQSGGVTLLDGVMAGGERVVVKAYGRDAADAAFAARLWRAIWYRNTGSFTASRVQLAEHEALALLAFERADIPAARMISTGRSATDDVLLVTDAVDGRPLSDLDDADLDDAVLDHIWSALADVHGLGAAVGQVDPAHLVVSDGRVALRELTSVVFTARPDQVAADHAQLLVALAISVGEDRAIASARRNVDDEQLFAAMPLLQTAALPAGLVQRVDEHDYKVKELRSALADALEIEAPELVQLRRVSWGGVAMIALTLFAAYSLITSLTEIGFDTIYEEMSNARWGWVIAAFTFAQLTNVGEYLSLAGVMGQPIPFGPTMMFRYALSFISLAVPSDAGAIAMNIRYQQKLGVPAAAAVAQGPLLTIVSKGMDVVLLLITAQFVSSNVDTSDIDFGPVVTIVIGIVVIALIAVTVAMAVPKWRMMMMPHVREGFNAVKGSLTDPDRLTKVLGGTIFQKVLFALTLSAAVSAYGSSLPFASAIFVNTAVSLFVGLMPVPGGIGVGEAALTAGLIAVGIPEEVAVAAAITHRMCTSYIPPMFGWWASRWLTARDYL